MMTKHVMVEDILNRISHFYILYDKVRIAKARNFLFVSYHHQQCTECLAEEIGMFLIKSVGLTRIYNVLCIKDDF